MPAYSNLRSKLARAGAAYLISVGGDCGDATNIFHDLSANQRPYPNTTFRCTLSKPETPFTGNRRVQIHVSIKGQLVIDPDNPNSQASRIAFDKRVAATVDALMQTDDEQTLRATAGLITDAGNALLASDPASNSDMGDFTCLDWYEAGEGEGMADADGCSWEEVIMFEAIACPSAIS